jgi:hypothetical protein
LASSDHCTGFAAQLAIRDIDQCPSLNVYVGLTREITRRDSGWKIGGIPLSGNQTLTLVVHHFIGRNVIFTIDAQSSKGKIDVQEIKIRTQLIGPSAFNAFLSRWRVVSPANFSLAFGSGWNANVANIPHIDIQGDDFTHVSVPATPANAKVLARSGLQETPRNPDPINEDDSDNREYFARLMLYGVYCLIGLLVVAVLACVIVGWSSTDRVTLRRAARLNREDE